MSNENKFLDAPTGPIAFMVKNRVAANLLMLGILAGGIVSLVALEREAWPTVPFNTIEVAMVYPGATPDEVEESIVLKIEERVEALEGVKDIKSLAARGIASVRVELTFSADINEVMDDVQSAVRRIQSFPLAAERPQFQEMDNRNSLIRLLVYGDISEQALKELAYEIEDELGTLDELSEITVTGAKDYEISVEVPLAQLRALGLTLDDIANAIQASSLDLSAGSIDAGTAEIRVRTIGQRYDQMDFEEVPIVSRNDGTLLRLGEIATVRDAFEESDLILRHQGKPALFIEIFRGEGEQVMDIARAVHAHVDNVIVPNLPTGVDIATWNDDSQTYEERVDLLVRNGLLGLLLVFISLALFLEIRLALWVVVGLIASGVGALAVMLGFGLAINTISLFSFVLAIGIIVDDAIVVSEHIHYERMQGVSGPLAAIRGTRRIKVALTFAVFTTVAAFTPLLFVPGGIGEVWKALPIIIIGMLLISLVESLFILPRHLSHLQGPDWVPSNAVDRFFATTRGFVDRHLKRFLEGPLDKALRFAVNAPGILIASCTGLLFVCISFIPVGILPVTLTEVIEGDFVTATLEMRKGTPADRTFAVARELEDAGLAVIDSLNQLRPADAPSLLSGVTITVGQGPRVEGGGLNPTPTQNPQANVAAVEFKLLGAQERNMSTIMIMQHWREKVGVRPDVRGIAFSGEVIDLGAPVEVVLSHPDNARLESIADAIVDSLRSVGGIFDVRSDHAPSIGEIQLKLRPEAQTLDLSLAEMARQVRAAFFGVEAVRYQRDRDEVRVFARLPRGERQAITDVEGYMVRTRSGVEVPLSQVATISMGSSPPIIRRQSRQRIITVTADVDVNQISPGAANSILQNRFLDQLIVANPELTYSFGGEQQQQLESLGVLYRGFILAMLAVFALLAIPLRSYIKPLIVMAIIPFGFVGLVLGHLILGVAASSASFMGFFGLAGVVVNDSLVMITFIDQRLDEGEGIKDAIIQGAKGRFRPIFLTSVTTFLCFTPLILERAIQAQFLIPFAASLGVGIMITTALLMVLVPALVAVYLRANKKR